MWLSSIRAWTTHFSTCKRCRKKGLRMNNLTVNLWLSHLHKDIIELQKVQGNNDYQMSRMVSGWGSSGYRSTSQSGEEMTWGKWQAKEIRYGLREADSNLMFSVTSNTRTREHNLELINTHKTKQQESNGWAVNQQKLAAKVTDALLQMWKIYMGSKVARTNTWRRHILMVIIPEIPGRNHNQEISKLKIPWGWEHLGKGSYIHTCVCGTWRTGSWFRTASTTSPRASPVWPTQWPSTMGFYSSGQGNIYSIL